MFFSPQLLSATDTSGGICVWKLPSDLIASELTEMNEFNDFVKMHEKDSKIFDFEFPPDDEDYLEGKVRPRTSKPKSDNAQNLHSKSSTNTLGSRSVKKETGNKKIQWRKSKLFPDPRLPLVDPRDAKNYCGVYSESILETILNKPKLNKLKPVIISNVKCTWKPSKEQSSTPNEHGSDEYRQDNGLTKPKANAKGVDSAVSHRSRNADMNLTQFKERNSSQILQSKETAGTADKSESTSTSVLKQRSFGNESNIGSTVAEVLVHSPSPSNNALYNSSIENDEVAEDVLTDEAILRGSSDAESLEMDSNPNSSSNAEDTVIEAKSQ